MRKSTDQLVIAISSRALFDLDDSHQVYMKEGVDAYCRYQIDREDDILEQGVAFPLVKKLLSLNHYLEGKASVEVMLLSRNSADTGLRIFNSIKHHALDITRAAFTGGASLYPYASAMGADLLLSSDPQDVAMSLKSGIAAAVIMPSGKRDESKDKGQLRIAFDGDAVIFSDEAEKIYQAEGLKAFTESEQASARTPLSGGPFKPFLATLQRIQQIVPSESNLIRTALVTARAAPTHERVIRTLRAWDIRIDEAFFLGGKDKGDFLKTFNADIFFDDQKGHCDSASKHVPTGHVAQSEI